MTTYIGGGKDPAYLDNILIKKGRLGKWEERISHEDPVTWYENWDVADPQSTLTVDSERWRVHYRAEFPLTFYYDKEFVFGVRKETSLVNIEYNSEDILWADIDGKVVVERGDFPRFTTKDNIKFSHTPLLTEYPNVFRLGNGFSIACNRIATPYEYGVVTEGEAWWMIAPSEYEEEISHRVLMVKVYDGPHPYQSRGTDIKISDPSPLDVESEYTIYSYDEEGLRGLYQEKYRGVSPQKYALTLRGNDLISQITDSEGNYRVVDEQLTGPCKVKYRLPLSATKLLNVYVRGSEVDFKIRPDDEDLVSWKNYDGKAVSDLEIEIEVFNSLASIRVEWESVKDWYPVGRPRIDIIPADWGGNQLRISSDEGEGLAQVVDMYTGSHTVSANVTCYTNEIPTVTPYGEYVEGDEVRGSAVIDVGGGEVVSWNPLNKDLRGSGSFVTNNDQYEVFITSFGRAVFTIDRIMIADAGEDEWLDEDIEWSVITDEKEYPINSSVNVPSLPVSLHETKRWKLKVQAPDNIGVLEHIGISSIYTDSYRTGDKNILRHVKWSTTNTDPKIVSRVYLPQGVASNPIGNDYAEVNSRGSISWEQVSRSDEGDVKILIDGSELVIGKQYSHRDFTIRNRRWRIEAREFETEVYLDDSLVGVMEGNALPFRISHQNTEDIQVDCPEGLIQMRRELGPRFEGWKVRFSSEPTASSNSRTVWGVTEEEAKENLPYYMVYSGS